MEKANSSDIAFHTPAFTSENVILVDAEYVDKVVFSLTVNFERMLGRRIPQADLATWLECAAMDGGLREGSNVTQVVLMHDGSRGQMENFVPGTFSELDGIAFNGRLGEFLISCVKVEETMVSKEQLFCESLQVVASSEDVKRLTVAGDTENSLSPIRKALAAANPDMHITLLTMQPVTGGNFRQDMLGYSLMAALGIRAEEIQPR